MNNQLTELDDTEKTKLLQYIHQTDIKQLRSLPLHTYNLDYLTEFSEITFDKKISPLLAACYVGKPEAISLLLTNDKVDVNLASFYHGYTPLMLACFRGYYEILRILLERKADVNKTNAQGQTPILFCFSRLEEQRYKYENKKILMMMVELLLSHGADINVRIDSVKGYTVLMKLASSEIYDKDKLNNTLEIIQFLIQRGADKKLKSFDGRTAFDVIPETAFKDEVISGLRNTEQIFFYNNTGNRELNTLETGKGSNLNTNKGNNEFYDSNITRTNCCNICKIS